MRVCMFPQNFAECITDLDQKFVKDFAFTPKVEKWLTCPPVFSVVLNKELSPLLTYRGQNRICSRLLFVD